MYGLFVAALVAVAGLLLISLVPITGAVEIKIVKSGSMEPAIKTGSIVVMRPATSYGVGDVVVFGEDSARAIPTTHRIIAARQEGGQTFFTTKGDANEEQDPREIGMNEILGKVYLSVPYAGYVLDFARQPVGFALLIGLPAIMIVADETVNIWNEIKNMRRRRTGKVSESAPLLPLPVPRKPSVIDLQARSQVFRDRVPTI